VYTSALDEVVLLVNPVTLSPNFEVIDDKAVPLLVTSISEFPNRYHVKMGSLQVIVTMGHDQPSAPREVE